MILMDGFKTQGHYNQPNQSQFGIYGYKKKNSKTSCPDF